MLRDKDSANSVLSIDPARSLSACKRLNGPGQQCHHNHPPAHYDFATAQLAVCQHARARFGQCTRPGLQPPFPSDVFPSPSHWTKFNLTKSLIFRLFMLKLHIHIQLIETFLKSDVCDLWCLIQSTQESFLMSCFAQCAHWSSAATTIAAARRLSVQHLAWSHTQRKPSSPSSASQFPSSLALQIRPFRLL